MGEGTARREEGRVHEWGMWIEVRAGRGVLSLLSSGQCAWETLDIYRSSSTNRPWFTPRLASPG